MALALRFPEEGEYSSRAVGASYDDEDLASSPPSSLFRWSKPVRAHLQGKALAVERLVVATSGAPQLFVERLTAAWHLIGSVVVTDQVPQPLLLDARRRPAACQILSFEAVGDANFGKSVAVIVPNEISNDALWVWIQSLQSHVNAAETIVLDSQLSPIYDFGYGSDDVPMLRQLASSSARDPKLERLLPTLETPRFVAGITAALLTQGELRHHRVRAFVSLRSSNALLVETARSFEPLVSLLDLPASPLIASKHSLVSSATTINDGSDLEFNALYT